ncbi:putative deoxyribonuclease TATDN3-like protein [Piromyces finnis]|uniref:Putative deoxyribonuclease TATDN3-like protein n=1 Tax=Piromyces finnis TaxID=1754191 RepID=A0A1Y1VHK0_9FUNG|nr:putative deoxyribonuclease TATDN3-like protein [Piromyces finnis]|eukprot:ORX56522.1 putative deoxyribonuclease TATDN3-like protein [Piromyces finnis]
MITYFDCHAHINSPSFSKEAISNLIKKAQEKHIKGIISVTETYEDCIDVLNVAKQYPNILLPGLGLHPIQPLIDENGKRLDKGGRSSTLDEVYPILDLIKKHKEEIVCIGEVGLDYSPQFLKNVEEEKKIQKEIFEKQIDLANEYNIPLNVHSRSAGHYAIETLINKNAKNVLLHAFDGKSGYVLKGLEAGYYFSIPPSIKRSPQKQKLVKILPLDRIILETDSPALSHEKGAINESSNVIISCEEIAKIKGISVEDVMKITYENSLKLFPKLKSLI